MSMRKVTEQKPVSPAVLNMLWHKINQMNNAINQHQWHQVRVHERYIQDLIKVAKKEDWWQKDEQLREKIRAEYASLIERIKFLKDLSEDKIHQLITDREGIVAYGLAEQG